MLTVFALVAGFLLLVPLTSLSAGEVLWGQLTPQSNVGANSQNYEPEFDNDDAEAADDFVVPSGKIWTIEEVRTPGEYRPAATGGPVDSMRISFYRNSSGRPGALVYSQSEEPSAGLAEGNFTIPLSPPAVLGPGRYWMVAQANMDFSEGQWFWFIRTKISGKNSLWHTEEGNGFPPPRNECIDWCVLNNDLAFQLSGTSARDPNTCPGNFLGVFGNHVVGTAADDTLGGTGSRDIMCGLGGNDTLRGFAGRDIIDGGRGDDNATLVGGAGNDTLRGKAGNDLLKGGRGKDTLVGGPGFDRCIGGPGKDSFKGCEVAVQ